MDTLPPYLRRDADGSVWLQVHVIPNARQTRAEGLHDQALRVRLLAPPVDGKANQALVQWVAAQLGIAKSQVAIVRGDTSKRKLLRIQAEGAARAHWQALSAD